MARGIRFIPEGGAVVEVTGRTRQGRLLLRPCQELRVITIGILARAKRLYGVKLHSFIFLSNHFHLLVSVQDAQQLASFMCYVNSNLAREAGRLYEWKEKFWGRRYQAIVVSNETEAQIDRLEYILSHGAKEGPVERPQDWPGAHSVNALLIGESLEGLWFDRTKEYAARHRGEDFDRLACATVEILTLDPLPCWSGLPDDLYRQRIASLLAQIEEKARAAQERKGREPLGQLPGRLGKAAIWGPNGKVSARKLSPRSPLRLVAPRVSVPAGRSVSGAPLATAEGTRRARFARYPKRFGRSIRALRSRQAPQRGQK